MEDLSRAESERKRKQREYNHRHYMKKKKLAGKEDERKVSMTVRLPEYLVALLHRMTMEALAKGTHSWATLGETVRAVLVRGIEQFKNDEDNDVVDEGAWAGIRVGERLNRVSTRRRQAEILANRTIEEVKRMQSIDADEEALRMYNDSMNDLNGMDPGAWRDWAIVKLQRAFPELEKHLEMKPAPGIRFVPKTMMKRPERKRG